MALALKAIDRLKQAANLKPNKRVVLLNNGDEFEFYCVPLTMAERERAAKDAKSDDAGAFALQLLVNKAQDDNGTRLFSPGDIAELKHKVRDEDLQKLMLAVLQNEEENEAALDTKSPGKGAEG
jgi:hypothetical protein